MKEKILKYNIFVMIAFFVGSWMYIIGSSVFMLIIRNGIELNSVINNFFSELYLSENAVLYPVYAIAILVVLAAVTLLFYRKRFSKCTFWLMLLGWLIPIPSLPIYNAFFIMPWMIVFVIYAIVTLVFIIREIKN